ncbi:MAG: orotate phosphoribosyltransferase [Candidatus Aenigmatarchaeota archaeon]|nr:MAG: orotate phosphoribosyltransferase [Candidatus Aenigmarchaeota archaeon]RLJ07963.1 MAG: orotate phosphoribosyltransferase [Candidatus Aenigmarchaeota archaeon]RLJ08386.1 MAG: orotate phosphoribosyltransferase [Candidatus Aenigmarchaeota archaeon]
MEVSGICSICGKATSHIYTCSLCGAMVCADDYVPELKLCRICASKFKK